MTQAAQKMSRTRAVIYVPADLSLDSPYTEECISYVVGRGYQLAALFRNWSDVDLCLTIGRANTVVVARRIYPEGGCTTQRIETNSNPTLPSAGMRCNYRPDLFAQQTPAQRLLEATAQRWENEFHTWLFPQPPGE